MSRRNVMIAAVFGSVLLGLAVLVGLAGHFATARQDDDDE
jgi:Ca2+/Na+ antiporter